MPNPPLRKKHRARVYHQINEQSAYETWCWGGPARADELVEFHRVRRKRVPEWALRIATAQVEGAISDIERERFMSSTMWAKDYRPDPDGARRWLHDRTADHALSSVWCEQVLNTSLDPLRRKYPLRPRQNRPVMRRKGPASRRILETEGMPNVRVLRVPTGDCVGS